ncbi:GH25 family lysozyme [Mesorhizobium sp. BAC0120]|uniref:glycoside hydrolase family 25 protein n=1 Tax=Mesorhizobium sp. BAC0120 TaxID=3090670 RepID=UPI00298C302C|nr:GH25 family lysozyme [Mesorhizobium sp. BAC0120]MDW6020319.1 GH25 family lysozyme [Mesorhizobium sp. BAC0120]
MRFRGAVVLLIACLGSAGCTSKSGLEDLVPRPSNEVTSSISRPVAPLPSEAEAQGSRTKYAMAAAPSDRPMSAVKEQETLGQEMPGQDTPELPAQMVALAAPDKPTAASAAIEAGTINPRRFRDAKPINFGKRSPRHLAVHGVDVSRWQGEIDWPRLRSQGANFAYIKATDGGDHLDPMFKKNWRAAAGAGLKRGAYHFFYWCRTAGEQADWFIRNVPKVDDALPPVIDVEWNGDSSCKRRPSRAKVLEKMQVFMDKLERHYGQRPIIYTSPDFYRENLDGAFLDYPFWVRSVAAHPSKLYPGRKWLFWQYSGSGLSHGVQGKIDLNVFHGTEAQWHAWANRRGQPLVAEAD